MSRVRRYDLATLSSTVRLDNGWLKTSANLTRVGVFPYRNADGSTRLELRPPAEVFNTDAIASFELAPVTVDHPPVGILDSKNTRKYQRGSVSAVHQDGANVAATVMLTDEEAIGEVGKGRKQLSCGYTCDLDPTPGVTSGIPGVVDGTRYDAIQRNIRGNHVALVYRGRAGENAALRLDANGDQDDDSDSPENGKDLMEMKMKLVKLDGVDYEFPETVVPAIMKFKDDRKAEVKSLEDKLATAEATIAKEKARADSAEEKLKASPNVAELVSSRISLLRSAEKLLGKHQLKLDSMSDLEIKKAAVIARFPESKEKLEKNGEAYVNARFDAALEEPVAAGGALNRFRNDSGFESGATDDTIDLDARRRKMMEDGARHAGTK